MFLTYIKGTGMMVGMILGAGIFGLPYVFSVAGLFWGLVHFFVTLPLLLFLSYLYGEVSYYTKGRHRFTGYAEIYLGKSAKIVSFITTVGSYYGSLLVYGILGGLFVSNFFKGQDYFWFAVAFFVIGGMLTYIKLSKIAEINFFLTVPLFGFIAYLMAVAIPYIDVSNFYSNLNFSASGDWFLPYGVWLFALGGFAAIPNTRDAIDGAPVKTFKKIILISVLFSAIAYLMFIFTVWGSGNSETTQDALSGVAKILGNKAFLAGSMMGFLAVFTSFLSLAVDTRNIYRFDFGISKPVAWLLTVIPPLALFLFGVDDFVRTIGIVGALGLGTAGTIVILMHRGFVDKINSGATDILDLPPPGQEIKKNTPLVWIAFVGILVGAVYELYKIFI